MRCKSWPSATTLWVVVVGLGVTGASSRADERRGAKGGELAIDLSTFAPQRAMVETELAKDQSGRFTRADLLAMLGRSSAASGDFELSAAAYAMFLHEFGTEHPYSEQIASRLIDSLAPLNLDTVDILHTPAGPRFEPTWRMGKAVSEQRLRQAVTACEYAAGIASSPAGKAQALLRMGWIQGALNDWPAATAAWERCATEACGSPAAVDALWLAAENQRWTGRPAEAAQVLRRVLQDSVATDAQKARARREIEALEAEARRDAAWLRDPVAGLQREIEQRRASRGPHEVYRDVMMWLGQRGERAAQLSLARWGMAQSDWPLPARLAAHADMADALLAGTPDEAAKAEAAAVLGALAELAVDDAWSIPAAIRRSSLLRDLGRAGEAASMWVGLSRRIHDPEVWEARVLPERIRVLSATGDRVEARRLFEELVGKHPDHPELGALRAVVGAQAEEGK